MERYICIHGHFYQPPRENPWLEAVELDDTAAPYHDWNERITTECYAPNAVARILDNDNRIANIVNNYSWMSFNFGPTLLNWLQYHKPDIYQKILDADNESVKRFSGHGSALAQIYNHIIMPLANHQDRVTQVVWGIRDFEYRFQRPPEGMWLAETAVDLETLDILAEHGIRFTILSPYQAHRIRPIGHTDDWTDASAGRIDPTRPYIQHLPSGRYIAIFFYDGPIARSVAFEGLLSSGERFFHRLMTGFDDTRTHAQLVHIATDGESYGHHHNDGDMTLAYVLNAIKTSDDVYLTNYGEYLTNHPPEWEVEIFENTAWSCAHNLGRWHDDCGCNSGGYPSWNQSWRKPLREAFDWLRDSLIPLFEQQASEMLYDPWTVRNDYISVILNRSLDNVQAFLARHTINPLDDNEQIKAIQLLELQRQLLLMYTSCGWFFDELSGIETIQVMKYAGRAIHLAHSLFDTAADIEEEFLARLEQARSNIVAYRNGRRIYERWIQPARVDLIRVGVHYAVTSLFEKYSLHIDMHDIYCFHVDHQEYHRFEPGMAKVMMGRLRVTSTITRESEDFAYGVMHFGDNNVNAGVCTLEDEQSYMMLVNQVEEATSRADIAEVVRVLDGYFGGLNYSIQSLFRDEQRSILSMMLESTLADDEAIYRQIYERRVSLMQMLTSLQAPLPKAMLATAEFVVNSDLRRAIAETPPDREYVESIIERAQTWKITLNAEEFTYTLEQTVEELSSQILAHPDDRSLLHHMDILIDVVKSMPFAVDFWKIQNTYYELIQTVYPEKQECADEGDEDAVDWTNHFINLGDKLGIRATEMQNFSKTPTVASVTNDILAENRHPLATYRIQFNPSFTFHDVVGIVPYLHMLGISHCYASPIFQARAGSSHGYDVCDHSTINPVLGGEEALEVLSAELSNRGMSIVLDIVPNHMGIGDTCNAWWMDVLENGPSSAYASYFDIEWKPVKPELANKVLLPILGDQYGRVLEDGHLRLVYEDGAFFIHYWEHVFPVAPGTYSMILNHQLDALTEKLDPESNALQEFQSILTAISYLPPRVALPPEKLIERNREKEVIKRRIASLYQESAEVRDAIEVAVQAFNGKVGDPRSYDLLDELINEQSYRLAYWRVAAEEINYRRFFDINDLAAIRTEDPDVFEETHKLIFRLMTEGKVTGLRIDHIDGLFDPATYFQQLQEAYIFHQAKQRLSQLRETIPDDETLSKRISTRVAHWITERMKTEGERKAEGLLSYPLYVVAEKILSEDEPLPQNWAVHGTTGYEFLSAVNGLFVNTHNEHVITDIYTHFTRLHSTFRELVLDNKKLIMVVSMDSEIYALSHQLERISEQNRRYRDFTLNMLTLAIREVIAALSVYRTYTDTQVVLARDRRYIEAAVSEAKRQNPRTPEAVFDFVKETLLLQNAPDFRPDDREPLLQWVRKFQQVSGPVMAKGVEDTTFYVYNRLTSLNEVGGHPEHFGSTVDHFHERNTDNQRFWPHMMLTTSTHDTKRSEDVRTRISVLSEMPDLWQEAIERWNRLNSTRKTIVEGKDGQPVPAPDKNDEYLLYQTMIGAWPYNDLATRTDSTSDNDDTSHILAYTDTRWDAFCDRIASYMQKATKEAKVHTSWVQPNQAYDAAVQDFVYRIMDNAKDNPFLNDIAAFVQHIVWHGQINSLAQVLLKLTSPGVPDIYQGTEIWDLSLVDPDNRRPVDYTLRQRMLESIQQRIAQNGQDMSSLIKELIANQCDGRIKLYLTYRVLGFRQAHPDLFAHGTYQPLTATGDAHEQVCAFLRAYENEDMLVVAPRLIYTLTEGQTHLDSAMWGDTHIVLPDTAVGERYRNYLTGEILSLARKDNQAYLPLADILGTFPVALLERLSD